MKTSSILSSFAFMGLITSAMADTFIMKDGTEIEGTILSKDAKTYRLEVNVTASIKDEKVVNRADVLRIKRTQLDLEAFEEIEGLVPTPDYLTLDAYSDRIKAVEGFLKEHRGSGKSRSAKRMLAQLKEEQEAIEAGGVKSGGKIIQASDYKANAYDLDAAAAAGRIKSLVMKRKYLAALRRFDEMEEEFSKSNAYRELVPTMQKVIKSYLASVQQQLTSFDARQKKREVDLDRMSSSARKATMAALMEREAKMKKSYEREKAARVGWITTYPELKDTLSETISYGNSVNGRLESFLKSTPVDGGRIYRETMAQVQASTKASDAKSLIGKARSAQLSQKYMDLLMGAAPTE